MFDRRFIQYFDWGLFALAVILGSIGLATLYSVVNAGALAPEKTLYFKQLIWFCAGIALMIISFVFNYKFLDRYAQPIYILCVLMARADSHPWGRWPSGRPATSICRTSRTT